MSLAAEVPEAAGMDLNMDCPDLLLKHGQPSSTSTIR